MLILVRGLPGSGKSTFAKRMFPQIVHLENDMFHMVYDKDIYPKFKYDFINELRSERSRNCAFVTRELLERGVSVVVSNVFPTKNSLKYYSNMAECFGHPVKVYRMINDFGNIHDVPQDVLQWMKDNFANYPEEYTVRSFLKYFIVKDQNGNISQYSY